MQFRHHLYFILLLSAGCNVKDPEKISDKPKPSECAAHVADKPLECVERLDAGVEIIALTEQRAKEMGMMEYYQTDPGFAKWCVLFHDIPGNPPYALEQKRLSQSIPDHFYPFPGYSTENILICKHWNKPMGIVLSSRGYLPGEEVVIRLSAKDAHREAVFYPRPLRLKKKSGELLAKGTLICAEPSFTNYSLDICGIGKHEKYKMISHSEEEIISHDFEGPIICGLSPNVIGVSKGIAKLKLQFEDGAIYTMELPWGTELLEYNEGNK